MVAFRPLPTALVQPDWANRVAAPAHDSMTDAQRAKFMDANPDSYLRVTRSPKLGSDETIDEAVAQGKLALDRLMTMGAYGKVTEQFYVYELSENEVVQRAIVGGADLGAYSDGRIKTHEQIHSDRLELLTRHYEVVATQSSPIALAHRQSEVIDQIVGLTCEHEPVMEVTNHELVQRVWPIAGEHEAAIIGELEDRPFYVIDGHHRLGSAHEYLLRNQTEAGRWAHVALFAANHLNNLAYHRILHDMPPEDFLAALDGFPMRNSASFPRDQQSDELLFYVSESWILVQVDKTVDSEDPLSRLDPVILQREILGPVFGFGKSDWRVGYRPGTDTIENIAAEVEAHHEGVLAVMRPVKIADLFAVADAGLNMPAKSTYFSPKVRSGIFLRPLTD